MRKEEVAGSVKVESVAAGSDRFETES